jgi:hypothetical protein
MSASRLFPARPAPSPSPSPSPWGVPDDQLPPPNLSPSPTLSSTRSGDPPLDELIPAEPTPAQPPPVPTGDSDDNPAWWDVGGRVRKAIDDWFRRVVESALNPMLDLVGRTLLATPDVSGDARVRQLWTSTQVLANTVFALFVLAGGAVVMTHETVQTSYTVKEIAPRLVVGMVAANTSLLVCGVAIRFGNALSRALVGPGLDPDQAGSTLRQVVMAPLGEGGIFLVLLGLVAAVLLVVLLVTYVVRNALVMLLVVAAPLALACHALPYTDGAARLWWRALFGCLAVQLGQSLTLITAMRVFFAGNGPSLLGLAGGGLVDLLVAICLVYILVRIPAWVARTVFGTGRGNTLVRVMRYRVIHRALQVSRGGGI